MLPQKRHRGDSEDRDRHHSSSSRRRDDDGHHRSRDRRDDDRHRPRHHRSRSRDSGRRDRDDRRSREPSQRPPIDTSVEEGEVPPSLNYDDPSAPTSVKVSRSPPRASDRDRRDDSSSRHPPAGPRADRHRPSHRERDRGRSPHGDRDHNGHRERERNGRDGQHSHAPRDNAASSSATAPAHAPQPPAEPEPEIELDLPAEKDPATILEERRRARAAILAKYSAGATPSATTAQSSRENTPALGDGVSALNSPARRLAVDSPRPDEDAHSVHADSAAPSRSPSPSPDDNEVFALEKDAAEAAAERMAAEAGRSAADYNPNDDRLQDERRQLEREGHVAGATAMGAAAVAEEEDDDDDMFAMVEKAAAKQEAALDAGATADAPVAAADDPEPAVLPVIDRSAGGQTDSFDDGDGYYRVILGELLDNGRYHVVVNLGKGMFSSVVRARDNETVETEPSRTVAIKIVRSQETMYKAGQKEAIILNRLRDADPQDKKHIVRLYRTFEHRGHLCLVFENLSLNLREVVKRFGKDVGINLRAVRAYAHQMFLSLNLMRKLDIVHADIKPDNILVNESKSQLKMCDLGSASDSSESAITPYLVSRFYRAPEIIVGLPYDCAIDMWSIGCTLYELYTGKILFAGRNNNHMLLEIQELRGRMPNKMLKKAHFADAHFDDSGVFISQERNKLTGQETVKKVTLPPKPASDLRSRLMQPAQLKRLPDDDVRLLTSFVDLLNRALELEPTKRLTPKEALMHPFLR